MVRKEKIHRSKQRHNSVMGSTKGERVSQVKSDILPAVKKAGVAGYLVSRTNFGGDPNDAESQGAT